jgi:hypothetical protein
MVAWVMCSNCSNWDWNGAKDSPKGCVVRTVHNWDDWYTINKILSARGHSMGGGSAKLHNFC